MLSPSPPDTVSAELPPERLAERHEAATTDPVPRRRREMREDMEEVAVESLMPSMSCMPLEFEYFSKSEMAQKSKSHSLLDVRKRALVATRSA